MEAARERVVGKGEKKGKAVRLITLGATEASEDTVPYLLIAHTHAPKGQICWTRERAMGMCLYGQRWCGYGYFSLTYCLQQLYTEITEPTAEGPLLHALHHGPALRRRDPCQACSARGAARIDSR